MSTFTNNESHHRRLTLAPPRRRIRLLVCLFMVMAMFVAACGSDDDTSDTVTAADTDQPAAADDDTEPAAAEEPAEEEEEEAAPADDEAEPAEEEEAEPTAEPEPEPTPEPELSELDQLIAAAQEEGELNFYGALSEAANGAAAAAFEEEYGIEVTFTRLSSTDLWQRFTSELDAGAPTADVLVTASTGVLDQGLVDGVIVPVDAESIPGYPVDILPQFIDEERQTVRVFVAALGIAYNTDSVSPDELPQSWEDLLDERWSGQIEMNPPSTADSIADFYRFLADEYGDEYVQQLAAQRSRFADGGLILSQDIAAGEAHLGIPGTAGSVTTLQREGAPIDITFVSPTAGGEVVIYPTAAAAHPNAARLFVHFMMTKAGNEAFNEDAPLSVTTSIAEGGPADVRFYGSPSLALTDEQRSHIIDLVEG